jgi:hypothetical protein
MTAKAWYWTGLGVLALSLASSGAGRCLMDKASGAIDQLRAKTVPYMAMAEMAMGRTQAGLGHMQSARARIEAQEARLQAAQARIEADRARVEALAVQREFKRMNVLADYPGMFDSDVEVPGVSVSHDGVVIRGRHGVVVCPHTRVSMPGVDVSAPAGAEMQDPI